MREKEYIFLCSYEYQGARWEFTIIAKSEQEAAQRLWMIQQNGRLDGAVLSSISLTPSTNLLTRLKQWYGRRAHE